MNVTEADVLRHHEKGSWRKLASIAAWIVSDAEKKGGSPLHPLLGGGTRVMLTLNHRISNDIDLFIRDPRWIGYLSPRLNSHVENLTPAYDETAISLKLKFAEGEIDFIVAGSLLELPEETSPETSFALEPIGEVLAKKLFHRGWQLTPRDLFDWWAIETRAPDAVPHQALSILLVPKYAEIGNALNAMLQSSRAAELWNVVQAPNKPTFSNTVTWGISRLGEYRQMAGRKSSGV